MTDTQTRKSPRDRQPTEKMSALQASEEVKIERKFFKTYGTLKTKVKEARNVVKTGKEEELIKQQIKALEVGEKELVEIFEDLRKHKAPIREVTTRMDRANAMVRDGINALEEVLGSLVGPFDAEDRKQIARELLNQEYAHSVFSSTLSEDPGVGTSQLPENTPLPDNSSLSSHQVAPSRDKTSSQPSFADNMDTLSECPTASSIASHKPPQSRSVLDMQGFAQALADNMYRNRLPVPVPCTFSGNPLEFIEFERSFKTLIGERISAAEKLYYLRQYVTGEARDAIAGFFYGTNESAYEGAWATLKERYGHPFRVQQAFRKRLDGWPKIPSRDTSGLQKFSDLLKSCCDAMPYVKGLEVLNDCNENQRLLMKLPEWMTARWNRVVSDALDKGRYPSFAAFVEFVVKETRIATNPITSLSALSARQEDKVTRPKNTHKSSALNTQTFPQSPKDSPNDNKRGAAVHVNGKRQTTRQVNRSSSSSKLCSFCSSTAHVSEECPELKKRSMEERKTLVKEKGLCFGCFCTGHYSRNCSERLQCAVCNKRHPTPLHESRPRTEAQASVQDVPVISNRLTSGNSTDTSMIVPVWVSSAHSPSDEVLTYALLDTQSDTSFILDDVAQALCLKHRPIRLQLSTMTSSSSIIESNVVSDLMVRGMTLPTKLNLKRCCTRNFIPYNRQHIPTKSTADHWPHLQKVAKEMTSLQGCDVGLLIGYDCPSALVPREVVSGSDTQPFAVKTELGWSIVGNTAKGEDALSGHCHRVSARELPVLKPREILKVLESDFAEREHDDKACSQDDIKFTNILHDTITECEDGHLKMPLPFKEIPEMPNNRRLAEIRLRHLSKKMERNDEYKTQYNAFMTEVIERGYAERVESDGQQGNTNYIPHHGVFHPQKKKLRVVFDCAAKFSGTCLNDHLLKGPDLTNSLIGVLLRFRLHEVALMCDIEKMFFQFRVNEGHQDFLRFLWWEGGETKNKPVDFRMKVHLFGAASSPGCANYGLKYLATTHKDEFPLASRFVSRNFYVDDGITSVPESKDAIRLAREAVSLCKKGGIRLHKFVSNSKKVIESIPESERASGISGQDLSFEDTFERALGIWWNVGEDHLCFRITLKDQPCSRRGILSIVASIYDPLGFVSPVILVGKRVLQEMCRSGIQWDDPIPESLRPAWDQWLIELTQLESLKVPRCIRPPGFGSPVLVQLHHFSDASTQGYGQCSYLRLVNERDEVHCSLIFAKSRVAPSKVVTIPRLELTAAAVSARVSSMLKNELEPEDVEEFFWTDSKVVLGYISNEARRFHTFVANRVQLILNRAPQDRWHYVPTDQNPADHASRGMSPAELLNTTQWWRGPDFLWDRHLSFRDDVPVPLKHGDPEVKVTALATNVDASQQSLLHRLTRISDWFLMIKVLCRLRAVAQRARSSKNTSVIDSRQEAERYIIQMVQKEAFAEELRSLADTKTVKNSSNMNNLDPYLDKDGILRVGGRLGNVSNPIILPKDSPVTKAIVRHFHLQIRHQGRGITQNEIRANGFWIMKGSRVVAEVVRNCIVCRRLRRPEEQQKMANLPNDRTQASAPFTYVGMDCFGPFLVKRGRSEVKRYGLLFTCFCSRGIHIEMLDDMSTDAFINALRSFIAIRGAVRQIRCDQGSNFIGGKNEFNSAAKEMSAERIERFLADQQCEFVFNAPKSSHAGGVWERQIRTVRSVLKATVDLSSGRLTDSALRTLLYEAMAIVNSRPLSLTNLNDPNADEPLTPNHLLTMKGTVPPPPPGEFQRTDVYARKAWRRVQFLVEQFWSRWRKEYLLSLQERKKWTKPRRNLNVGDIVLLVDSDVPRMQWPLAVVVEASAGPDGLVRKVRVRVGLKELDGKGRPLKKPSELWRPIQKIVLLMESS